MNQAVKQLNNQESGKFPAASGQEIHPMGCVLRPFLPTQPSHEGRHTQFKGEDVAFLEGGVDQLGMVIAFQARREEGAAVMGSPAHLVAEGVIPGGITLRDDIIAGHLIDLITGHTRLS